MADQKFLFTIITPEGEFYKDEIDFLIFRSTEGDMGVLAGHIAVTAVLTSGPVVITKDGNERKAVVHGGFIKVQEKEVIMLPDAAEWPEEIDLERAQAAKERALKRIEDRHQDEVNIERANAALARALMRIEMAQH